MLTFFFFLYRVLYNLPYSAFRQVLSYPSLLHFALTCPALHCPALYCPPLYCIALPCPAPPDILPCFCPALCSALRLDLPFSLLNYALPLLDLICMYFLLSDLPCRLICALIYCAVLSPPSSVITLLTSSTCYIISYLHLTL